MLIKGSFIFYADLKSLMEKINRCENNAQNNPSFTM